MVSRVMTRKLIALPLAATLMAAGPALAQQVGTATVVNPVSQGTAPGGAMDKLAVGARAMHNERIHTFALWIGRSFCFSTRARSVSRPTPVS